MAIHVTLIENALGVPGDWCAWASKEHPGLELLPLGVQRPASYAVTHTDPQRALETACRRVIQQATADEYVVRFARDLHEHARRGEDR